MRNYTHYTLLQILLRENKHVALSHLSIGDTGLHSKEYTKKNEKTVTSIGQSKASHNLL